MAENSNIEWTTHTFNPWIGCAKVSPGCANCYAETLMDTRYGRVKWGKGQPRSRTSEENWKKPLQWQREAERTGVSPRVFCASLADWLDDEVPVEWLADLLALIKRTPNLDWLLLSKRLQNWESRLDKAWGILGGEDAEWVNSWRQGDKPFNVWLGTTVEDQQRADERIPQLLSIPARVRFLSCEPLLGAVDITTPLVNHKFMHTDAVGIGQLLAGNLPEMPWIDWVICGGESGPGARLMYPEWARSLRNQCAIAGVRFFFKQWGGTNKAATGRELDGRTWDEFPQVNP